MLLVFFYTLALLYPNLTSTVIVEILKISSLIFYFFEILTNFVTVKFANGRKIDIFKDIWIYYLKNNFAVDFVSFLILIIDAGFAF